MGLFGNGTDRTPRLVAAERLDADPPDTGVYRIWYEE
jgi:hypothetical protein